MKRTLRLSLLSLLIAAAWLAGCGAQPTPEAIPAVPQGAEDSLRPERETGTPAPALAAPEGAATMPPSPTPGEIEAPAGAEQAVQLAREELARQLGLAPEAIRLVSVQAVEWPDTSLGCPQPGMMYAQVITPGFRVILEAAGEQYEFHTDQGGAVELCEAEHPTSAPPTKGPDTTVKDGAPNQPYGDDVLIVPPMERK